LQVEHVTTVYITKQQIVRRRIVA